MIATKQLQKITNMIVGADWKWVVNYAHLLSDGYVGEYSNGGRVVVFLKGGSRIHVHEQPHNNHLVFTD